MVSHAVLSCEYVSSSFLSFFPEMLIIVCQEKLVLSSDHRLSHHHLHHRRHLGSDRDQCIRVTGWAFETHQHRSRSLDEELRGGVRMDGSEPALLVSGIGSEAYVSFFVATPSLLGDMVLGSCFCFVASFNALALRGRTAAEAWVVFVIVGDLESGLGLRSSCSIWCGVTLVRQLSCVDVLRSLCRLTLRLHW